MGIKWNAKCLPTKEMEFRRCVVIFCTCACVLWIFFAHFHSAQIEHRYEIYTMETHQATAIPTANTKSLNGFLRMIPVNKFHINSTDTERLNYSIFWHFRRWCTCRLFTGHWLAAEGFVRGSRRCTHAVIEKSENWSRHQWSQHNWSGNLFGDDAGRTERTEGGPWIIQLLGKWWATHHSGSIGKENASNL